MVKTTLTLDALGRTHAIFKDKVEEYKEVRPPFRFLSMRNQSNKFIRDEKAYGDSVEDAYDQIAATSRAASQACGLQILLRTRDVLHEYGSDMRERGHSRAVQHRFQNLRIPSDIPETNQYYRRKCKKQKIYFQTLAADFEAQSLMIYLEKSLVKSGYIVEGEKLQMTNELFKLHPKAEEALDDLRMILLA